MDEIPQFVTQELARAISELGKKGADTALLGQFCCGKVSGLTKGGWIEPNLTHRITFPYSP